MTAASDGLPASPTPANRAFAILQRVGKSLMLPIATLPAAALLLRLGQPDMFGYDPKNTAGLHLGSYWTGFSHAAAVMVAAGNALINNLPLIFAVGVAVGFAKRSDGSTALAAVVGYLVYNFVSMTMFSGSKIKSQVLYDAKSGDLAGKLDLTASNPTGVLGGIFVGIIAALLYQRYYRIKLPTYLAFFGGRRFVPIVTAVACLVLGVVMGWIWAPIGDAINSVGDWTSKNGELGASIYGAANRALLPFGLHHILNSIPWFTLGSYTTPNGTVVHGDIARFLNGDKTAGMFMSGFFPIMMFGLPGAAIAMWRSALPAKRKVAGGILLSAAFCSFLTGVTEPIEFAFMFLAPALYAIHVVLTGASMALAVAFGAKDGFGFSAGAIDFALNWNKATRPWVLLLVGAAYFIVYYLLFSFVIRKFNLATPGREPEPDVDSGVTEASESAAARS